MEEFTRHEFTLKLPTGDQPFTSIVTSDAEFDSFIDTMKDQPRISAPPSGRMTDSMIEQYRTLRFIPLVSRGELTAWIFDRYAVTTPIMAIVVRGHGPAMAEFMNKYMSN